MYLRDLGKWVFIDPQYALLLTYNGRPLNAVELQHCIASDLNFEILNPNQTITKEAYKDWVGPYLYYFTTTLKGERITIWDRIAGIKSS